MQLSTPFVTAIGIFEMPEYLLFLRKLFEDKKGSFEIIDGSNTDTHITTLKGYGGLDTTNDLDDSEEANKFKDAIKQSVVEYANACGYASDKYEPIILNFWLNEMKSGGMSANHVHNGMHFSGCFYIDMPENSAGINFQSYRERFDYTGIDVQQYTPCNTGIWKYKPTEGQMFLWESWVRHEVPRAEHQGIRRSAAFDVVMKRKNGNRK